jgi:quaternary ammonium compound-resistance protein SugE
MTFATTPTMAWALLVVAGLLEVVWAIGMKYSEGFSRLVPSVVTIVAASLSFWLLATAMKVLPVGTAYAAWTGIGAVGAALLGMVLFKEPATAARIACVVLIIAGIAGLKWLGPHVDA